MMAIHDDDGDDDDGGDGEVSSGLWFDVADSTIHQ